MLSVKLNHWQKHNKLPQRLLLSGGGDLWTEALKVAAAKLELSVAAVESGLEADVKLCPDDGETLKIGERQSPANLTVRGLINWLNQTPVAKARVLILQNLERTSRDAMQAWLKVLEEPPARAQFILTTQNHHCLPTTILSRVTVLPLATKTSINQIGAEIDQFLSTSDLIAQFQQIDKLDKACKEDPKTVKKFMTDLLQYSRTQPRYQPLLPILFKAHQDLERHVNRRLVLEHLALQLQNR